MYQAGLAILMAALAGFATLIGAVVGIAFSKQMRPITFAAALASAAGCTLIVAFGDVYSEGQEAWRNALKASEDDQRVSSSGLLIVLAGWLIATGFDTFLHFGLNCYERAKIDKSHHNHHPHLGLCAVDMPHTSDCVHDMQVTHKHQTANTTTSNIWSKIRHSKVLKIFTGSNGLSPEDEMRINQQFMSDTQCISRLGYFTASVLALHNIPEGIALYGTATSDTKSGVVK